MLTRDDGSWSFFWVEWELMPTIKKLSVTSRGINGQTNGSNQLFLSRPQKQKTGHYCLCMRNPPHASPHNFPRKYSQTLNWPKVCCYRTARPPKCFGQRHRIERIKPKSR